VRERFGARAAAGFVGALTLAGLAACASSSARLEARGAGAVGADCDAPSVIAHRGETGDGRALPENSAEAEVAAAAEGATYLNLDVRWTSDEVPVALHDATVDRTTSEQVPRTAVTALTADQYTALNARTYAGDTGQGQVLAAAHPQTLAQMLAAVSSTGRPIIVQMEGDPYQSAGQTPRSAPGTQSTLGGAVSGGAVSGAQSTAGTQAAPGARAARAFANLAQVVEQSPGAARVIVAGWTLPDLAAFHAVAPRTPLAYLFETIGAPGYPTAAQLTAAGARILYIDFRGVTAARVRQWHREGLKVWVWTPSSRAQWQEIRADGVDAIATDRGRAYLAWAAPKQPCGAQY